MMKDSKMSMKKNESGGRMGGRNLRLLVRRNRFAVLVLSAYIVVAVFITALSNGSGDPWMEVLWLSAGLIFLGVQLEHRKKMNERLAVHNARLNERFSVHDARMKERLSLHDESNRERFRILNHKINLMRTNSKSRSERLVKGQERSTREISESAKVLSSEMENAARNGFAKIDELKNYTSASHAIQRAELENLKEEIIHILGAGKMNDTPTEDPK